MESFKVRKPIDAVDFKGLKRADIHYKTMTPVLVATSVGVLLIIYGSLLSRLCGVIFCICALGIHLFVKDRVCTSIYDEGFIVYDTDNLCRQYIWDEVVKYRLVQGQQFEELFEITLVSGEIIQLSLLSTRKVLKYFDEMISENSVDTIDKHHVHALVHYHNHK